MSSPPDDQDKATFVLEYLAGIRDCQGRCGRRVQGERWRGLCFWCSIDQLVDEKIFLINHDGYPIVPSVRSDTDTKGKR